MKQRTKNLKAASLVVLSALCISTASLGFALGEHTQKADAAEATPTSTWKGGGITVNEAGIAETHSASVIYNTTNVLEAPDRTLSFNAYFDNFNGDGSQWSGMGLVNGIENATKMIWPLSPSYSKADFPMNNVIFHNDAGQYFRDGGSPAAIGISSGTNVTWDQQMLGITVHIGTGVAAEEGGEVDYSYIAFNNTILKSTDSNATANQATSLIYDITTADYPNGCYFAVHHNAMDSGCNVYLSEPGSIYNVQASCTPNTNSAIQVGSAESDAKIRIRTMNGDGALGKHSDEYTYVVKVNGHALEESDYTLSPSKSAYVDMTISKDWFNNADNLQYLKTTSFVTLEVYSKATETEPAKLYGTGSLALTMLFEAAPVLVTPSEIIIDETKDVDIKFEYDGSVEMIADNVKVYSALSLGGINKEKPLTADDYTVTKGTAGEDGKVVNTLTIKKSYLDTLYETYSTQVFVIEFGTHSLQTMIYRQPVENGWYYRSVDYVKDTLKADDFYTSAEMNVFSNATLSTRMFNFTPLDVTKPIILEMRGVPADCEWTYFGLFDKFTMSDTFNESADAKLAMIFFGGRNDFQKMKGIEGGTSTNLSYTPVTMRNFVMEIYFAPETASEGYLKINGTQIAYPACTQGDFANSVAYAGFFFNANKGRTFDFTVNTNMNPVYVTAPTADSAYAMDFAEAKDFTVTLANTSGNLTLKDETGATIPAANYEYNAENGTLTVKAAYFTNKTFTKAGTIYIYDTEKKTGTSFRMAYSSSKMGSASLGFATLGSITDVEIPLEGVTNVNGVLKGEELLENSLFSFANGKLTIKSSAIENVKGTQEFIAISGSDLYPCYVVVRAWNESGLSVAGLGTVKSWENTTKITGKAAADVAKLYDLTKGYTFAIDFANIDAYYENARNANATSVTLKFYDPYTGYTLSVALLANFEDGKVSATNNALYLRYGITNADGNVVLPPVQRGVNISNSQNNTSAKGLQSLAISATGDALTITAGGRAINVSDLKGFNTGACMLTIDTTSATDGSVALVTVFDGASVNVYEQNIPSEPSENPPVDPGKDPGKDPEKPGKKGCGSAVGFASLFATVTALAVAATAVAIVAKKKHDDN